MRNYLTFEIHRLIYILENKNNNHYISLNIDTFEILDFTNFSKLIKDKDETIRSRWIWLKINQQYKIIEAFNNNNNDDNNKEQQELNLKLGKNYINSLLKMKTILNL